MIEYANIFITFSITSQEYAKFLQVAYAAGATVIDVTLHTFSTRFIVKVTAEVETLTYLRLIYTGQLAEDPGLRIKDTDGKLLR